jgi:hypothetical protein
MHCLSRVRALKSYTGGRKNDDFHQNRNSTASLCASIKQEIIMINKTLIQVSIVIFMGLSFSLLSFFLPWRPEGETMGTWFQRSGSILVALSVLAEYKLIGINSSVNPGENTTYGNSTTVLQVKLYKVISSIVFISAIIGTIIWGYGDIPFNVT